MSFASSISVTGGIASTDAVSAQAGEFLRAVRVDPGYQMPERQFQGIGIAAEPACLVAH